MGRFHDAYPEGNEPDRGQQGRKGFGDDAGTRIGSPDPGVMDTGTTERDSAHSGAAGTGAEATRGTGGEAAGHEEEHVSRYGGHGGVPKHPG